MKPPNEIELVQNVALGGLSIWTFVTEFERQISVTGGPTLPMLMPVFPVLCQTESRRAIMGRQYSGGLLAAIAERRSLFVDLQERMISMADKTLRSINVALSTDLVYFNPESGQFFSNRTTPPIEISDGITGEFIRAARRLGRWAAEMNPSQYYALLRVRF